MTAHKHTYNWSQFKGSPEALKWNMRDLTSIDRVLELVPGRQCCVQAGGNLGVFPKYLARFFAMVLTFEPSPKLFPHLVANAWERNIVRVQAALGDAHGLIGMKCSRRGNKLGAPVHEGLTHVAGPGIVPTLRLDDFALPVVDLLYLDLEGYEQYALRGALETLQRCRPVLAVEINQNTEFYGIARDEVRAFILAQGYHHVERMHSDEFFVPIEGGPS